MVLDALLDEIRVGHIELYIDGHPLVVPTAIARDGDAVLVHGSPGSRWMRVAAEGAPACLAVTSLDGVLVARSAFESSFHYRSAVVFGGFERLEGEGKKRALDIIVDKLIPGRLAEVRPSSQGELNKTLVLSMPIEEWWLKVSDGSPEDPAEDVAGPAWAGVVPLAGCAGEPRPAPDLRSGIPIPPSVAALVQALGAIPGGHP